MEGNQRMHIDRDTEIVGSASYAFGSRCEGIYYTSYSGEMDKKILGTLWTSGTRPKIYSSIQISHTVVNINPLQVCRTGDLSSLVEPRDE